MDLLKSLSYPDELLALLRYKMATTANGKKADEVLLSEGMKQCYEYLKLTSRSFAAVIQALDDQLRDAVCIFYLVLRALDTVEDDMSIELDRKVSMLKQFYTYLEDPQWSFLDSQEKDRMVLVDFPVISGEYRKLRDVYREVISDICRRMGEGMTVFLTRSPDSLEEWDEYCHYVAGLVGHGLNRLFSGSGLEDPGLLDTEEGLGLANSMGLFLQKTNIIRDYLEDVRQDRLFWPKQVWSKYAEELGDLGREENCVKAVRCLNDLITNSLLHIPHVLQYLSTLKNQTVFNFCAIPQVMAIATLERCYNNVEVFRGVVKIRKGEAVKLMLSATDIESVKSIFTHFTERIKERIPTDEINSDNTTSGSRTNTDSLIHQSNGMPTKTSVKVTEKLIENTTTEIMKNGKTIQLVEITGRTENVVPYSQSRIAEQGSTVLHSATTVTAVNEALQVSRTAAVYSTGSCWAQYFLSVPFFLSLLLLFIAILWSSFSTYLESSSLI